MMQPELKQKWINALRSNEYQQGKGTLRSINNEYCCLGVLCDVYDNSGWNGNNTYTWEGMVYDVDLGYYDVDLGYIDRQDLLDHFGISLEQQKALVKMNDGDENNDPQDFEHIAQYVENNL